MLRALFGRSGAAVAVVSFVWMLSAMCEGADIVLRNPKTAHFAQILGGMITEIPGLAAQDGDYVNQYETIDDPDAVDFYRLPLTSTG